MLKLFFLQTKILTFMHDHVGKCCKTLQLPIWLVQDSTRIHNYFLLTQTSIFHSARHMHLIFPPQPMGKKSPHFSSPRSKQVTCCRNMRKFHINAIILKSIWKSSEVISRKNLTLTSWQTILQAHLCWLSRRVDERKAAIRLITILRVLQLVLLPFLSPQYYLKVGVFIWVFHVFLPALPLCDTVSWFHTWKLLVAIVWMAM